MVDMKQIIPKDKLDLEAVANLETCSISEIKNDVLKLLEWLQDMNWPVAGPICDYFAPFVNNIDDEIIYILRTNDDVWKYWIINSLVGSSGVIPNDKIVKEITRIAKNPTDGEKGEGVQEAAIELLEYLRV